jgi:hypothetical protein
MTPGNDVSLLAKGVPTIFYVNNQEIEKWAERTLPV